MTQRPLPKTLQDLMKKSPEKFDEGWSEQDAESGWSHWIYLKPGFHASKKGTHLINETTTKNAAKAFRGVVACDCGECAAAISSKQMHRKPVKQPAKQPVRVDAGVVKKAPTQPQAATKKPVKAA